MGGCLRIIAGAFVAACAFDILVEMDVLPEKLLEALLAAAFVLYGFGFALRAHVRSFQKARRQPSRPAKSRKAGTERLLPDEPARANYFLDRAFSDCADTARKSFAAIGSRAKQRLVDAFDGRSSADGAFARTALSLWDFAGGIALVTVGIASEAAFSLLHAAVVAIGTTPCALAVALVGAADALQVRRAGLKAVCPTCKASFSRPSYRCPACGAVHYRLKPGRFGVLRHSCTCGQKLPRTWFGTAARADGSLFKRADLDAVCPTPAAHPIAKGDVHTVCIPLAGGGSAGKTAFANAIACQIAEEIAPGCGLSVDDLPHTARPYRAARADFASGEISPTPEPADSSLPTAQALGIRLSGQASAVDRAICFFDVPGAAFVENREHERQLQYACADGVVLVIDPLSIPAVHDERFHRLGMLDAAGVSSDDPDRVLAALVAKMQDATGTPASERLRTPLAIVLSKIDQAGLASSFGTDTARTPSAGAPATTSTASTTSPDPAASQDALCRAFLADHGMENLLNTVATRFETARYFACSAVGHARGCGPYAPRGALEPIAWILEQADPVLYRALGGVVPPGSPSVSPGSAGASSVS